MEENNNLNNNQMGLPEVNEVPATPVTPEINNIEAQSVPSLVIEDTSAPVSESAPVNMPEVAPVVPEMPVEAAPVTPIVEATPEMPAAPEMQIAPETPVAPVMMESPVVGVNPEVSNEPAVSVQPEMPTSTMDPAVQPAPVGVEEKPKKKNHNVLAIIVIILCIGAGVFYFLSKKTDNPTPTPTPTPTPEPTPTPTPIETDLTNLSLNQVSINGVTLSFPETKTTFSNIGWNWDQNYALNDVEPASSTNGGRIGTAPGGAIVMVYNKNSETTHVEDCSIYSATFYNPKDGSESVTFVGGLGYTANPDTVKSRMTELGYTKVNETVNENLASLRYFLNDDETNANSFVEFNFQDNTIETVTVSTAY